MQELNRQYKYILLKVSKCPNTFVRQDIYLGILRQMTTCRKIGKENGELKRTIERKKKRCTQLRREKGERRCDIQFSGDRISSFRGR